MNTLRAPHVPSMSDSDSASSDRAEPPIGVFGRGRLGTALAESLGTRLAWQVGRGEVLPSVLPTSRRDAQPSLVAIDASIPDAVDAHVNWALEVGSHLVIAVTGWIEAETLTQLEAKVADRIGVVLAPNGSLSVALMARFARILGAYSTRFVPGADGFLLDHHHRGKRDSPSGTALRLADAWAGEASQDRDRTGPVIASIRAGHEVGLHVLGFDAPAETLEIRHQARSRDIFAHGLITAVDWVRDQRGLFAMDDIARELLDPLFRF